MTGKPIKIEILADGRQARQEIASVERSLTGAMDRIRQEVRSVPGLAAIAQALAPISGLAAAAPVALLSVASAAGAAAVASIGFADALKGQLDPIIQDTSARVDALATAQKALRNATRSLSNAQQTAAESIKQVARAERELVDARADAKRAELDIAKARDEARKALVDLRLELQRSALDERDASLAVKRALREQRDVLRSAASTQLDREEAAQKVAQAEQDLKEATAKREQLQKDANKADKAGVNGSEAVQNALRAHEQALQAVADATDRVSREQLDSKQAAQAALDAALALKEAQVNVQQAAEKTTVAQQRAALAMESLAPAARAVVEEIKRLFPTIDGFRQRIQQAFFLPLIGLLTSLTGGPLPKVADGMANVAGAVAGFSRSVVEAVLSGRSLLGILDTLDATTQGINTLRLGNVGGNIAEALGAVLQTTAPLVDRFAKFLSEGIANISKAVIKAADNGDLTKAIETAITATLQLGHVLANIGRLVDVVFTAAERNAGGLLNNLGRITDGILGFLNSAEGQSGLDALFSTLAVVGQAVGTVLSAVLPAVAQAVTDIAPALQELAPALAGVLVQLAPLIPVVAQFAAALAEALIPILNALTPLLRENQQTIKLMAQVLLAGGLAWVTFGKSVNTTVGAINAVKGTLGEVKQISGGLSTAFASFGSGSAKAGSKFKTFAKTAVSGLANFGSAAAGIGRSVGTAIASLGRLNIAQKLAAAGTRIFAAAQAALNLVLSLNPIGLIVLAVAALVAGLVLAYRNSETFRRIVNNAFSAVLKAVQVVVSWIRENWPKLLLILTGPFGPILALVFQFRSRIIGFFGGVIDWVKRNWPLLLAPLLGPFGLLLPAIVKYKDRILAAIKGIPDWVRRNWPALLGLLTGPFAGIVVPIIANFQKIKDFIGRVFTDLPNMMRGIGRNIMDGITQGLKDGIRGLTDTVTDIGEAIPDNLKRVLGIASPSKVTAQLGAWTIEGFTNALAAGLTDVSRASQKVAKVSTAGLAQVEVPGINSAAAATLTTVAATTVPAQQAPVQITVNVPPTADKAGVGKAVFDALNEFYRTTGRPKLA